MEATERFQDAILHNSDIVFGMSPHIGEMIIGLRKGYEQQIQGWTCERSTATTQTDSETDDTGVLLETEQIKIPREIKVSRLEILSEGLLITIRSSPDTDTENPPVNLDILFDTLQPLVVSNDHPQTPEEEILIGKYQGGNSYEKRQPKMLKNRYRIIKYHDLENDEDGHSQLEKDFLEERTIILRVDIVNSLGEVQKVHVDAVVIEIVDTGYRLTKVEGSFKDYRGETQPCRLIFHNGCLVQFQY